MTQKQEHIKLEQIIAWNTLYGTAHTHAQHNATTREGSRVADVNTGKNSEKESRVRDRNIVESSASTREESRMVGMDTSKHRRKRCRRTGNQRKEKAREREKHGAHGEVKLGRT